MTKGWSAIALALAACGSGSTPAATLEPTGGGEEPQPIACDVPGSPAQDVFDEGMRALEASDAGALEILARACDAGNACACTAAGTAHLASSAAERGIELLERACSGSHDAGCYAYASAIWRFRSGELERASEAYATACGNGHAPSCQELGRMRMSGIGGSASPEQAVELYERACRDGAHFACFFLAQARLRGLGVEADEAEAREGMRWACETAGVPQACTAAAEMFPEERDGLLARACEGGDPFACDARDPEAAARAGTGDEVLGVESADAGARDVSAVGGVQISTQIGGDIDLSAQGLRPSCVGFVDGGPTVALRVPAGLDALAVLIRADADSVMAVRDPSGRWHCADDTPGGAYHAALTVPSPAEGIYAVWGGLLEQGTAPAQILAQAHGGPRLEPAGASADAIAIPRRRLRHYQLQATSVPGVTGRVRLDGHDVSTLTAEGGMVSSNLVQCILGAGRHTIEIEITSVDRAFAIGGAPLIRVDLHGLEQPGIPDDASRVARIDWSPAASATRSFTFDLARNQAGDRASCAR